MREEVWKKFIDVNSTILLTGETGTGKSTLAKDIHYSSKRRNRPFMILNLACLNENLLESEMFGHVKGAFTGAVSGKSGYCDAVKGGTLFLDEIGELSLASQKKLLFLLEERKYAAVGSYSLKNFVGRIIVATNRNLKSLVDQGKFREDLYYRLMIYRYRVPSLRSDPSKLKRLMTLFWEENRQKLDRTGLTLSSHCEHFLANYSWPGNIRELKNCMEYLVQCSTGAVEIEDLPCWMKEESSSEKLTAISSNSIEINRLPIDFHLAISIFEKQYLLMVLERMQGRINQTARQLNVSKSTLIAKIRKHGINTWKIKAKERENENNRLSNVA